jgi:hypothetical protein
MLESLGKADKTLASKSDEVMFSSGFYEMIGETSRTIFVGVFCLQTHALLNSQLSRALKTGGLFLSFYECISSFI